MSKNQSSHVQIPKEQTRKQLSRAERDARQQRTVLLIVGGVFAAVILIVAFGWLRENVLLQNEPVANVNGEAIITRNFQSRVKLARAQLVSQRDQSSIIGDSQTAAQAQSQLDDVRGLGAQILSQMVDELLLKQGAAEFGVSVSPEEVQANIEENFNYFRNPPTPEPTRTPAPTPTVTEPITQTPTPTSTPFPTATPVTADGFQQLYREQLTTLGAYGLSEQDYRQYVELSLLGNKVRDAIAGTVLTTTEQVKFKYIRIEPPEALNLVSSVISATDFAEAYQQILSNTFPITTVQASETFDWVPGNVISESTEFGPEITNALFSVPVSQTTGFITNTAGTALYIAFVQDRGVQPLGFSFLQQAQQQAQDAWLEARRNPTFYLTWEDRVPSTPN